MQINKVIILSLIIGFSALTFFNFWTIIPLTVCVLFFGQQLLIEHKERKEDEMIDKRIKTLAERVQKLEIVNFKRR